MSIDKPLYFQSVFEFPIEQFKLALNQNNNERIIFSGRYGTGKTSFLAEFFSETNQTNLFGVLKFQVFRLSPINYSIASNEDIIRYIKYDIIMEMLRNGLSIEDIKLNILNTLPVYLKSNLNKVLSALVYMIPKLGKDIVESFEKFDDLKEQFLKEHDKINESDGDKLSNYLEMLEAKDGGLYENDVITKIISKTNQNEEKYQSVLIIDDVDRLDPEHVFRILNVFASHFDAQNKGVSDNKFNFDKIIIVCDISNIRNIFHHRYGDEVDFMGYIDKFYSSDIYHFDNVHAVKGIIGEILTSIIPKAENQESIDIFRDKYLSNNFILDILSLSTTQSLISLRSILKQHNKIRYYHRKLILTISEHDRIQSWKLPVVMQLRLLQDFMGDFKNLKKSFQKLKLTNEFIENHRDKFGELLYLISFNSDPIVNGNNRIFNWRQHPIIVEVYKDFGNDSFKRASVYNTRNGVITGEETSKGDDFKITKENYLIALEDSVSTLHALGSLM